MSRAHVLVGVALATAGAALLVVGVLRSAERRAGGEPPPGVPALEDCRREGEDLDARLAVSHARLCDKHEVVTALIRGEIGLREAAGRFRVLVAGHPAALDRIRQAYPRATETELLYRHILKFVRGRRSDPPGLAPGLLDRLEAELAATFPTSLTSQSRVVGDCGVVPIGTRAD